MNLHYSTPLEFKAPDAGGEFLGYLAVLDSPDMSGDVILPGAFRKTLTETKARGVPLPLLWAHDQSVVLGKFIELNEDAKGLHVRGRLTLETQAAREKYALLKDRSVTGLSIGYSVPDGASERRGDNRLLKEIDLHEGSLVSIPMHPDARVTAVKSALDCTHPRELERLLRERLSLSSRKAIAAATALWPILNDRDGRDDDRDDQQAEQLKAFAASIKSFDSIFKRI